MTISEFKTLGRELKKAYSTITEDVFSPEYQTEVDKTRNRILKERGFTLAEYRNAKEKHMANPSGWLASEIAKEDAQASVQDRITELENKPTIEADQIYRIAEDVAKAQVKPPQIIHQIVKETTIEKPTIVTNTVVQKVEQDLPEKTDLNPVYAEIGSLNQRLDSVKQSIPVIPTPPDLNKLKGEILDETGQTLKKSIEILGMPDFRKLAMGLDGRISTLENKPSSGGTPGGSDTQVQYNDGGVFGGDSNLVWDKVGQTLTISKHTRPILGFALVGNGWIGAYDPTDPNYTIIGTDYVGSENGLTINGDRLVAVQKDWVNHPDVYVYGNGELETDNSTHISTFLGAIHLGTQLGIAYGGTNNTSFTSGSVLFYDGTKINENNSALSWNNTTDTLNLANNVGAKSIDLTRTLSASPGGAIGTLYIFDDYNYTSSSGDTIIVFNCNAVDNRVSNGADILYNTSAVFNHFGTYNGGGTFVSFYNSPREQGTYNGSGKSTNQITQTNYALWQDMSSWTPNFTVSAAGKSATMTNYGTRITGTYSPTINVGSLFSTFYGTTCEVVGSTTVGVAGSNTGYAFYTSMGGFLVNWAFYNNSASNNFFGTGFTGFGTKSSPGYTADIGGDLNVTGSYGTNGTAGITATITTAALTTLGTQGSMTFTNGILTAQTPAT